VTCNILKTGLSSVVDSSSLPEEANGRLVIKSDAYHGFIKSQEQAVGYFSGESEATKRPNFQSKSGSNSGLAHTSSPSITSIAPLGKIDTNSAESQALQKKSHHESSGVAPDLIVSAGNSIRLETLSWIGRIQQKYGVKSS
jgi:hypothetical protein